MNIYYYLFYKLSRGLDKKGNNEWGPITAISFLIGLNIGLTYINIFPVTRENFSEGHKILLISVFVFLYLLNTFLFLNKKRRRQIISRYKDESLLNKRTGNLVVMLYITITLLSIFIA